MFFVDSAALSQETLVRFLLYISGVASTIVGSLVSSKIHVYHENRRVHLQEIKDQVLNPLSRLLIEEVTPLALHERPVVEDKWGERQRKEKVSVTEYLAEHGPLLIKAVPDTLSVVDQALYLDAKRRHFPVLIGKIEQFLTAWNSHAQDCYDWIAGLADEILTHLQLPPHPVQHGSNYVMQYRLAIFVYRRLFGASLVALQKRNQNPGWAIEGSFGTVAVVSTEEQAVSILSYLDEIIAREGPNAEGLKRFASTLQQNLVSLRGELNYAVAARRLQRTCDLVPFF